MKTKDKLVELVKKIKISHEESKKANSYADGYLDCLKDIMLEKNGEIGKVFGVKYDGEIRMEVYSELLPILEDVIKEFDEKSKEIEKTNNVPPETIHPSERTKNFLQRIGRI